MPSRKILVLLGNPDVETISGRVVSTYEDAAREAGHAVARINIGDLRFDPVLHRGYKEIQELEPDLVMVQEKWKWADHVVIVYPNWWCTMPAVLKGMFDRMYLPGFAFNFNKKTKKVIERFQGKTARVIIVTGTHGPFMTWLKFGDCTNEIAHGILGFSGMKTRVTNFAPTEGASDVQIEKWLAEVKKLGQAAC